MSETATKKRRGRGIMLHGLRSAREDAGMTLIDLEQATQDAGHKIYGSTISELERGKHGCHPRTARALANALGLTVKELREPDVSQVATRPLGTPLEQRRYHPGNRAAELVLEERH